MVAGRFPRCVNFSLVEGMNDLADRIDSEAINLSGEEAARLREESARLRFVSRDILIRAERVHQITDNREPHLVVEDSLTELSQLLTELILTNREGSIDYQSVQRICLQLSTILTELVEISLTQREITSDIRERIVKNISKLFREIMLD